MKTLFNTEHDAREHMQKHQIYGMVPELLSGGTKWGLVYPIEANVSVRQPHAPKFLWVSVDGGATFQPAPDGAHMMFQEVPMEGGDDDGELHINVTPEAMTLNLWKRQDGSPRLSIGSETESVQDIVSRLLNGNT